MKYYKVALILALVWPQLWTASAGSAEREGFYTPYVSPDGHYLFLASEGPFSYKEQSEIWDLTSRRRLTQVKGNLKWFLFGPQSQTALLQFDQLLTGHKAVLLDLKTLAPRLVGLKDPVMTSRTLPPLGFGRHDQELIYAHPSTKRLVAADLKAGSLRDLPLQPVSEPRFLTAGLLRASRNLETLVYESYESPKHILRAWSIQGEQAKLMSDFKDFDWFWGAAAFRGERRVLELSQDGTWLLYVNAFRQAKVLHIKSRQALSPATKNNRVLDATLSPDGKRLLLLEAQTVNPKQLLPEFYFRIWDLGTKHKLAEQKLPRQKEYYLDFKWLPELFWRQDEACLVDNRGEIMCWKPASKQVRSEKLPLE